MTNAPWFSFFNAVSFQIFLGPPMVLYAKSLGASATLLGVLASLMPLLTIFQIPAAHHIPRFGYRRFFLAGWSLRNVCVFAVTLIPLCAFLGPGWKLVLLLGFQLLFNFLRGVASGAWFPWITELLPEKLRARYLSREQRLIQAGCLLALAVSGLVLQRDSTPWEFSVVFLISALGGATSLFFLNRIPDVDAHALARSGTPVPWRAIIGHSPFRRLLGFNLLYTFAFGSVPIFTVSYLKARAGFGENQILLFSAVGFLTGSLALPTLGSWLDRIGPKPMLYLALTSLLAALGVWSALAGNLLSATSVAVAAVFAFGGVAGSASGLTIARLQMDTMPAMGRSHFFAMFTVINMLCLGVTPIFWGICIDALATLKHTALGFEWNRYSVYFVGVLAVNAITLAATALLQTPGARNDAAPETAEAGLLNRSE